ncbi:unnamed protein product [Mytilus edulis]|uniref:Tyr recombinase domain-containing protein n=1 Tax=Mytilus edulis TaxID=6550 RepID=A0A8S3Q3X0_MYTED|nr:unnamed protein product [Mytilus edulis]
MHMLVCCRSAWDDVIPINDNILKELKFWYFECESLSFQRIVPINRIPQRVIFTDASQYAGAGFIMNDNKIVHFMFDGHERSKSSTWRELKTVEKNISSFKSDLTGKFVKLYTDNQNVVQIVKKDQWKQFECYANDSRFASIIRDLPSFVESSRSNSTIKKYKCYFKKFEKWCVSCSLECLPATTTTISMYIGGLIQQGSSVAILDASFYSIKWFHDFNFKHNPCSDKFLGLIYEGGRRLLSKPINKKEPITPDILRKIVLKFGDHNNLKKLRVVVLFLLGFSGFLRYSELANIKMNNIEFQVSHVKIRIDKSKTDLYRRGNSVVIAATVFLIHIESFQGEAKNMKNDIKEQIA